MAAASSITSEMATLPGVGDRGPSPGRILLGEALKSCSALFRYAEQTRDEALSLKAQKALEALMAGMFEPNTEEP